MRWFTSRPPIHAGLGYAIINGHQLAIDSIRLDGGQFILQLSGAGPSVLEGPITLVGVDGRGVCQGQWVPRREIPTGALVRTELRFKIDGLSDGAPFRWNDA